MGVPVPVGVVALDPVLEAGTRSTLLACPELTVCEPGNARVAVLTVDRLGPAELDMVRTTRAHLTRPAVVLVAGALASGDALHALAAGARGLLLRREADASRLAHAVLAAAQDDCTVPTDLLEQVLDRPEGAERGWVGGSLSDRERSVLRMVADGHETAEIAQQLAYSPRTVTTVVHDITQRFRLRNRAHAVAYALRAGLL
ncbi:LuxR C-terminal-related transcriptional regulator [Streptomyces griseofuscus]|uniref:LuxR family transcriptional regulator n=1 Tax=Streptomyces griseofuscus TaxID=146922 RepID=A0A7H1PSX3_9ACTN|nr:response regulator transcription factor [Streptomyces griseofuscus]QNT91153.1 LuxR family transcriptional regulator [Streptomyces griseofuscus]BBC92017.1 DNA-binding response regulator [Streptomyces rochei]